MRSRSAAGDRIGDFLIAGGLATFPLLPAGAGYLGRYWPWALETFFLSVVFLGLVHAVAFRPAAPSARPGEAIRLVRRGYLTWLIPVVAATVLGVMERGPFNWEILRAESVDLAKRLLSPMHQVADPMYPVRVGLTCVEGGALYWLLTSALGRTADPRRRLNLAIDACLLGLGIVSTIAIFQYFTRVNLLDYWVRANPGLTRSHSTLDDPNSLASFLVLGIGLAVGVVWPMGPPAVRRRTIAPLIVVALAGAALVCSVSRAGLAALVFAAAAVLLLGRRERSSSGGAMRFARRAFLALVGGAVALGLAATALVPRSSGSLPGSPAEAVAETFDLRQPLDRILKGRLEIWPVAIDLGFARPVFGQGLGQFPRLYSSYPGADGPENAHNYFLQVFAEMGVVGLLALAAFLFAIASALFRPRQEQTPGGRNLQVWLSVGVLAFVLTWVTGHPMLNLSNSLWFATVLAVGLTALKD